MNSSCSSHDAQDQPQRNRPGNLTYQKISYGLRVNVIYSRKVLDMSYREISNQLRVNYNSVRNIIKQHDDCNTTEDFNTTAQLHHQNTSDAQGTLPGDHRQIPVSGNSKKIKKNKVQSANRMRFLLGNGNEFKEDTVPNFQYRHISEEENHAFDKHSHVLLLLPDSCLKFEKQSKLFLGGLSNFNGYKPSSTFHKIYKLKLPICKAMRDKYELDNNPFAHNSPSKARK